MKPLSFLSRVAAAPDLWTSTPALFPTDPAQDQLGWQGRSKSWIPDVLQPMLQFFSQEGIQVAVVL